MHGILVEWGHRVTTHVLHSTVVSEELDHEV